MLMERSVNERRARVGRGDLRSLTKSTLPMLLAASRFHAFPRIERDLPAIQDVTFSLAKGDFF